jgi:hypothetical protein
MDEAFDWKERHFVSRLSSQQLLDRGIGYLTGGDVELQIQEPDRAKELFSMSNEPDAQGFLHLLKSYKGNFASWVEDLKATHPADRWALYLFAWEETDDEEQRKKYFQQSAEKGFVYSLVASAAYSLRVADPPDPGHPENLAALGIDVKNPLAYELVGSQEAQLAAAEAGVVSAMNLCMQDAEFGYYVMTHEWAPLAALIRWSCELELLPKLREMKDAAVLEMKQDLLKWWELGRYLVRVSRLSSFFWYVDYYRALRFYHLNMDGCHRAIVLLIGAKLFPKDVSQLIAREVWQFRNRWVEDWESLQSQEEWDYYGRKTDVLFSVLKDVELHE